MQILYMPNDCSVIGPLSFSALEGRTSYDWQDTAMKLSPKTLRMLGRQLQELPFMYSRHGTYSQATSKQLNMCFTGCIEFASNQL